MRHEKYLHKHFCACGFAWDCRQEYCRGIGSRSSVCGNCKRKSAGQMPLALDFVNASRRDEVVGEIYEEGRRRLR